VPNPSRFTDCPSFRKTGSASIRLLCATPHLLYNLVIIISFIQISQYPQMLSVFWNE
jgi:hypothetical protein